MPLKRSLEDSSKKEHFFLVEDVCQHNNVGETMQKKKTDAVQSKVKWQIYIYLTSEKCNIKSEKSEQKTRLG